MKNITINVLFDKQKDQSVVSKLLDRYDTMFNHNMSFNWIKTAKRVYELSVKPNNDMNLPSEDLTIQLRFLFRTESRASNKSQRFSNDEMHTESHLIELWIDTSNLEYIIDSKLHELLLANSEFKFWYNIDSEYKITTSDDQAIPSLSSITQTYNKGRHFLSNPRSGYYFKSNNARYNAILAHLIRIENDQMLAVDQRKKLLKQSESKLDSVRSELSNFQMKNF